MFGGPNRTVLVAGASGVIGRRLCRLLVDDGCNVDGMTRSDERAESLAGMGITPLVVDVFDAARFKAAVVETKRTIVVHMLTDLPPALAPAAAGAQRMVAQSVCFAYAPGPTPYPEDRALNAGSIAGNDTVTARGIIALERQVMAAPPAGEAVHVDAAADAARRAVSRGKAGAYNIAEDNSTVVTQKAKFDLDWRPAFRMG